MTKYIVKRLIQTVPLLFLITVLCFTLMNLAPYDAVDAIQKLGKESPSVEKPSINLSGHFP